MVFVALWLGSAPAPAAEAPTLGQIVVTPGNPRWLSYHQLGSFFMAGPGDPEDFLYRGTLNPDGTRDGDQMELIEKLAPTGANSIYFAAVGTDDKDPTSNPFIDHDAANGLNQKVLDQWETWFSEMDRHGIVIFFIFYNDGVEVWPTGDVVGPEERAFLHAIVDRFEHHNHLIWVVAEEYEKRYTPARVSAIAAEIQAADDHGHAIGVHKLPNQDFPEFADDPYLDQMEVQRWGPTARDYHEDLLTYWDDAQGRYNLNLAEGRDWGTGQEARQKAWAAATAGAYVMGFQMDIANTPVADLEDLGRLRDFMERTDFQAMEPRDDLADGDTSYVLARVGKSYIAYASGGSGELGLRDFVAGSYRLLWLDTATGAEVVEDGVALTAGPQAWPRPAGIGPEAAVYALRLDGDNDPPVAYDRAVSAIETAPTSVFLAASDPDGPGPYTYTIVDPPDFGDLSGAPPELLYSADPGFLGIDSFTWIVHDGRDDSNLATMTIEVGANVKPIALDAVLSKAPDTPIPVALAEYTVDPDGPGPYTYTILTQPEHGELTGAGADWTYTPDPGFSGTDSFTWKVHDGLVDSNTATVTFRVQGLVFADDFERPDSAVVGNGWRELEDVAAVSISGGTLAFAALDEPYRPLVDHALPLQTSGQMTWRFDLDFVRSGREKSYSFLMQLGLASAMSDTGPAEAGVAVNLIWGGLSSGLETHEGLGYLVDGVVTHLATVSGRHSVEIEVDLDASTYRVAVDDLVSDDIPFDESVPIDTVRHVAHGINGKNFSSQRLDDVFVSATADDGVNNPPQAFDGSVSTIETVPVDITLQFSDPDGPGPYFYTIVDEPSFGSLSGTAPELTYTADPGFVGTDSFTWFVSDGEADSNLATVTVSVVANVVPVALDSQVSTLRDTPVSISLAESVDDADGPGPYTYTILTLPAHGELAGSGPDWTYTPDPGFTGTDSFTWQVHDGLDASSAATVTVEVVDALFADDFERPDSGIVGNGWREVENVAPLLISSGNLVFDAQDEAYRPLAEHALPPRAAGRLVWSFDLDFVRSGKEKNYSFHMQLGEGSAMSETLPAEAGVAVNLIWGSLSAGLATHEGLGWVVDGVVTQIARVSGRQSVQVEVDLDARTYRVTVAGQVSADVPFDEDVSIDTVRYVAHGVNRKNFSSRQIDNLVLSDS